MLKRTPCETCGAMKCRSHSKDCYGIKETSQDYYQDQSIQGTALAASRLVDNGRAGTLARVEEVVEYCKDRDFKRIGLAYCFGMAKLAKAFADILKKNDLEVLLVTCTAGGVKEKDIDDSKLVETVSCNPAGQAIAMNRLKPDLVVEMGLCLGHDIIFHQILEIPFTVLIVKDRLFSHDPASFLEGHTGAGEHFLKGVDDSFGTKSPDWLRKQMKTGSPVTIIDLRPKESFDAAHITGSMNFSLKELPDNIHRIDQGITVVCLCNGGIQAAYAVMYLSMKGFKDVFILSGGFSRWQKEQGIETG
jgi:uncharacterized metal-binding protein/rhodanese-related sulfurtransferase